eukprot:sb/3476057/
MCDISNRRLAMWFCQREPRRKLTFTAFDPDIPGPSPPRSTPVNRVWSFENIPNKFQYQLQSEGQLPPILEIYVISPRYTGHPDLPGKTLSPEHPGKSGSDCTGLPQNVFLRSRFSLQLHH